MLDKASETESDILFSDTNEQKSIPAYFKKRGYVPINKNESKVSFYSFLKVFFPLSLIIITMLIFILVRSKNLQEPINQIEPSQTDLRSEFFFLQLSDIHLDIDYRDNASKDTFCHQSNFNSSSHRNQTVIRMPYGRYGCDTPLKLFDTVLSKIKQLHKDNGIAHRFIIVLGDFSPHKEPFLSNNFSDKLLSDAFKQQFLNVSSQILKSLRNLSSSTLILPSFGNNDSPKHNRLPFKTFRIKLSKIQKRFIYPTNLQTCPKCDLSYLEQGLYYQCQTSKNLYVISLNTIVFMRETEMKIGDEDTFIAEQQLDWLNKTLYQIKNWSGSNRIMIIGHVPPVFSTQLRQFNQLDQYKNNFFEIIRVFKREIIGLFFAHTHLDDLRVNEVPIIIHPSISVSPFRKNPAFREYSMRISDNELTNYRQHILDLDWANWRNEIVQNGYEFRKAYAHKDFQHNRYKRSEFRINTTTIIQILQNISASLDLTQEFLSNQISKYVDFKIRQTHLLCLPKITNEGFILQDPIIQFNNCLNSQNSS